MLSIVFCTKTLIICTVENNFKISTFGCVRNLLCTKITQNIVSYVYVNCDCLCFRFELPFNIWCNGCGSHIGMGVRYNSEKSQIGKYYTTPIFKFRMKCHLCDNYFEIETDPKVSVL